MGALHAHNDAEASLRRAVGLGVVGEAIEPSLDACRRAAVANESAFLGGKAGKLGWRIQWTGHDERATNRTRQLGRGRLPRQHAQTRQILRKNVSKRGDMAVAENRYFGDFRTNRVRLNRTFALVCVEKETKGL
jgi:hypothetical protein